MKSPDTRSAAATAGWVALLVVPPLVLGLLRSAEQTPDGLSYALDVRAGEDLWHPHHLLYAPVARLILLATPLGALGACVAQNLLALPLLAWAARGLAARVLDGRLLPLLAAAALLATRGVVYYATHAETYLPAMACAAVTLLAATGERPRRMLLMTALTMAVLYHQTNVLLVGPLLVLAGGDPLRRRATIRAVTGAAVLVAVVYVVVFTTSGSDVGFWGFVFRYAQADVPAWGNATNFGPDGLVQLAVSQARNLVPVPRLWVLPAALAFAAGFVALVAAAGFRCRRGRKGPLVGASFVMLGLYLPFFLWWMPGDPDFFLVTVLPLWILGVAAAGGPVGSRRRLGIHTAVAATLAAGNLAFTAWPMHRDPGPLHRQAMALHAAAPPAAFLVVGYGIEQELRYHTDRIALREGHRWCAEHPGGAPAGGPLVVGRGFLEELLASPGDEPSGCLTRLLAYDPATGRSRAFAVLPGGLGLYVEDSWKETGFRADLRSDVQRELDGTPLTDQDRTFSD